MKMPFNAPDCRYGLAFAKINSQLSRQSVAKPFSRLQSWYEFATELFMQTIPCAKSAGQSDSVEGQSILSIPGRLYLECPSINAVRFLSFPKLVQLCCNGALWLETAAFIVVLKDGCGEGNGLRHRSRRRS